MMLKAHFLLITGKSEKGHSAKVLSHLDVAPMVAGPCLEAPDNGRLDPEIQPWDPPADPDSAGSSTGSAARENTNKPTLLI